MEPGKSHRDEYQSYRPNYEDHRPREDGPRPNSYNRRPSIPSRSNSRWDQQSRFRSPDKAPSDSPSSPQSVHGQLDTITNAIPQNVSRDPRRARASLTEQLDGGKSTSVSAESTFEDYFRELVKQALHDERLRQANEEARIARKKEEDARRNFPNHNPLLEMYASIREKADEDLSACSKAAVERTERIAKVVKALPAIGRDLLSGVVPTPAQPSRSDETEDLKTKVGSLLQKVDTLTVRIQEQEAEIGRLKDHQGKNGQPGSNDPGGGVGPQVNALIRDTSSKFAALSERLAACNKSTDLHEKDLAAQKLKLQKQGSDIEVLGTEKQTLKVSLNTIEQRLEKLEAQASETAKETPTSPPSHEVEDELAEIRSLQQEQKRQIANLSNIFVSRKDNEETLARYESLQNSIVKFDQGVSHCQRRIDLLESSRKDEADPKKIITMLNSFPKLQDEVQRLTNFSVHYTEFYNKTQETLKELDERINASNSTLGEVEKTFNQRLNVFDKMFESIQKSLEDCNKQQSPVEDKDRQSLAIIEKRLEKCESRPQINIDGIVDQVAAAFTDIKALKFSNEKINHSIQSLDTRYSAISTQKLYNSIVATIQPLLPRLADIPAQSQLVGDAIAKWEQTTSQMQGQIKAMERSNLAIAEKIEGLETSRAGFPTPSGTSEAVQITSLPGNNAGSDHANLGELSELKNGFSTLQSNWNRYASENSNLRDKLEALDNALNDQKQKTDNLDKLLQKWIAKQEDPGRSKESKESVNEALDELKVRASLELMHKEDKKMNERLRTDIEILDDLQTCIQRLQTDVKTQEQCLSEVNAHHLELATRLDELQTQLPVGVESNDVEDNQDNPQQTWKATIQNNVEDLSQREEQLRRRVDKLSDLAFPVLDRYVVCNNLASVINDAYLREKFNGCPIKAIQFRGGKVPNGQTTRRALIWISPHPNTDSVIDLMIQEHSRQPWSGRRVVISKIEREEFKTMWMEDHSKHRHEETVEKPLRLGASRDTSVSIISKLQTPEDDTIEVKSAARSSVLPRNTTALDDDAELPDSDLEGILNNYQASRDGQRSGRPQIPRGQAFAERSSPALGTSTKRGAPPPSSPQRRPKRSRRDQ